MEIHSSPKLCHFGIVCCGSKASRLLKKTVAKTEVFVTGPAQPLIRAHWYFYKEKSGKARSQKLSQPGWPGSYEEALKEVNQKNEEVEMFDQIPLTNHHCLATTPSQSQHLGGSSNFYIIIKEYKLKENPLQHKNEWLMRILQISIINLFCFSTCSASYITFCLPRIKQSDWTKIKSLVKTVML